MTCFNCGHEIDEDARFCMRCGASQQSRRARWSSATGAFSTNNVLDALKSYWWLLLIGVAVAGVAAITSVAKVDFGTMPPGLERRVPFTYTATARLLVTSAETPYFRTTVPRTTELPDGTGTTTFRSAPDIGTLITSANLYPILIESDDVRSLREEMAGPLPGSVTARAIYAVSSASRFELSQVPVVEIYANASTYGGAVRLAGATVNAFTRYIDQVQDASNLEQEERILLKVLTRPDGAVASGGSSLSLPLMLFVLIVGAFAALALVLNRLFPFGIPFGRRLRVERRTARPADEELRTEPSEVEGEPQPERSNVRA
jgi:zinc-ribbon domain